MAQSLPTRAPKFHATLAAAVMAGALAISFSGAAHANHHKKERDALAAQLDKSGNIVANAAKVADLSTLVAAVKAAGLVETLSGPGPFTVLAPSNAAFAALPAGTVDTLLKPENKSQLSSLLTYHVVPGSYTSTQLIGLAAKNADKSVTVKTVQGESLKLTDVGKGHWTVTDAKGGVSQVVFADLGVSNGTVFTVDKVLMP